MIDADVHNELIGLDSLLPYLSEAWRIYLRESNFRAHGVRDYPAGSQLAARPEVRPEAGPPGSDIELLCRQVFDEAGAELAILNCGFRPGGIRHLDLACDLASAVNDWQISTWLDTDERFRGSIVVVPRDPLRAAAEIDRAAAHPGFVQVVLPVRDEALYGCPRYRPIFEAAARHDLVIYIAFGGATGLPPTPVGWPSTYVEEYVATAGIFQSQLINLIFDGVFAHFPSLRVVLGESGWTWMPAFMWRMDKEWKGLRRQTPWVRRPPSAYIREHVRLTTAPTDVPPDDRGHELRETLDALGAPNMLLYASDYPHWHGVEPDAWLSTLEPAQRRKICHDNAAELYALRATVAV